MDSPLKQSRWRLYLTIATFVAMIALVYGLRKQIGDVVHNLGRVNAAALLLMIPLEIANYDVYARFLRSVYGILGKNVRYNFLFRLMLELNFVNHLLPSGGISGISYVSLRTRSQGISAATSTLTQVIKLMLLFISFQPLLVLGLFFLALRGHANNLIMVVASSIITLLVIGTLAGIYIIEDPKRINNFLTVITRVLNRLIGLFRRGSSETINVQKAQQAFAEVHENYKTLKRNWRKLKAPLIYLFLANATEIATIYVVYIAFGRLVNVGAVILAYAVANFAGLISVLPAGIGIYEGLMTAVLAATGIPPSLSIPVTVMYRVLNMVIQLTPGYFFYQKALHSNKDRAKN